MMEEITPSLFEHLVALAAFAFDPEEADYLRRELNAQLQAIHQIKNVSIDQHAQPASHGVTYLPGMAPPLRQDVWEPCDNPEDILSQAPHVEEGYLIVPDTPHTELE